VESTHTADLNNALWKYITYQNGIIYFSITYEIDYLLITDIKGSELLMSDKINSSDIDLNNYPSGVYLIQLKLKGLKSVVSGWIFIDL
jgi:hypothetical protein